MPMSTYQNALLPMISYPQPTLPSAIAAAVDAAAALNLRVFGLNLEVEPPPSAGSSGYAMPFVGATIDVEEAKTFANAEAIAREFLSQTRHRGMEAELRRVVCHALDASGVAAEAARLFDITIVTLAPHARTDRELAEAIVFGSGRPVLLLPPCFAGQLAPFDRVLVAWDASRASARALCDALPLLRRANEVSVVSVSNEHSRVAQSMSYVERWLSDHRVHANCTRVDLHATTEFCEIANHAKNVNANILVMGAFGHSRIRDFILGGVTKSVLANMTMPVLFSH